MTRTTFRMKVAVGISLAVDGIGSWGIRLDRPARAGQSNDNPVDTKATAPDRPKDGVWAIKGVVVDERGKPVAGAVVHAREEADPAGAKTAANGEFTLGPATVRCIPESSLPKSTAAHAWAACGLIRHTNTQHTDLCGLCSSRPGPSWYASRMAPAGRFRAQPSRRSITPTSFTRQRTRWRRHPSCSGRCPNPGGDRPQVRCRLRLFRELPHKSPIAGI